MKRVILFTLILAAFIHPASAGFNLTEAISNAASSGFNIILESITDQAYQMFGINSTNVSRIFTNIMISPNDFIANPQVQKEKDYNSFWYGAALTMFILLGAVGVMKEASDPYEDFGIQRHSWRNTYFTIIICAILIWMFYLQILNQVFNLEYIASKGVFMETMEFVLPTANNALAYFVFGLMRLLLILYGIFRYIAVGIITAYALIVLILGLIPWTSSIAKMIIQYGLLLLAGRLIIVAVLLVGVGIVDGWGVDQWGFGSIKAAAYLVVLIFDIIIALVIILYPLLYMLFRSPVSYVIRRR